MLVQKQGHCSPSRTGLYQKSGSCLTTKEKKEYECSNGPDSVCVAKIPRQHADKIFRPKMPQEWLSNKRAWLSTTDIENVMQQYDEAHPDFSFVGIFPINFSESINTTACISPKICNVPKFLAGLHERKKSHFGMVFNLDRHDEPGSHWVALYGNIDPTSMMYGVYYYDSMAMTPSQEFKDLMSNLQTCMHEKHDPKKRPFCKQFNKHRRQYKNSECGVFSMIFLILALRDHMSHHFRMVCDRILDDDNINKHRDILFRV